MMKEIIKKQQRSLKKGIFNLAYKQGFLFDISKYPDNFREMCKKWSK